MSNLIAGLNRSFNCTSLCPADSRVQTDISVRVSMANARNMDANRSFTKGSSQFPIDVKAKDDICKTSTRTARGDVSAAAQIFIGSDDTNLSRGDISKRSRCVYVDVGLACPVFLATKKSIQELFCFFLEVYSKIIQIFH